MATQLRLVDPPPPAPEPPSSPRRPTGARPARARITGPARRRRGAPRAASWGEWELDARTRRIGRAGVAAAREALERTAATEGLSRAS